MKSPGGMLGFVITLLLTVLTFIITFYAVGHSIATGEHIIETIVAVLGCIVMVDVNLSF